MGCCLTKKSRKRDNKGLNETLLVGEGSSNELTHVSPARTASINGYTPVQMSASIENPRKMSSGTGLTSTPSMTGLVIDGLDNMMERSKRLSVKNTRRVVGTSLLELPPIKSLKKVGWLQKRGHMVRNWKRRFVVLNDGEIVYFDKANRNETNGAGKAKGRLHLLGAINELKESESSLPAIEIIGRQGEKDLLLQFSNLTEAHEWYDVINWTIFRWNLNSIESGDGPEETSRWYHQQLVNFEVDFEDLEKGYTYSKHGFDSITGDLNATNCIIRGYRDEVCLKWYNITEEDGKKKKSQPFTIYLSDIVDLISGTYENDDAPMISIVTTTHTLDLQVLDSSANEVFMTALKKCLLFMSIPVPPGMTGAEGQTNVDNSSTLLKANKKAGAASKHGKL